MKIKKRLVWGREVLFFVPSSIASCCSLLACLLACLLGLSYLVSRVRELHIFISLAWAVWSLDHLFVVVREIEVEEMDDDPLDRDARIKLSIGTKERGDADGQFNNPLGLVFDHHRGLLLVADTLNHRVQLFSCDDGFSFVSKFGKEGNQPGHLQYPEGIAIDHDHDRILVTDSANHLQSWSLSEQSFLSCPRFLACGDVWFFNPRGITIDKHHHRRLHERSIGVLVVDRSVLLVRCRRARISAWQVILSKKPCDRWWSTSNHRH